MNERCFHTVPANSPLFSAPWSFETLIHPVFAERFCTEYWGRRPLRIKRQNSGFYKGLISLAELERYLSLAEFFDRHSSSTPSREAELPAAPPASISEVYERILNGNSLRLRRMERFLDPAGPPAALLRSMETTLQHPCDSLSCYLAPPSARGLGPHHDETEIFTLQISGTKRWRLFHRVDSDECGLHEPDQLGAPTDDFVLEPGDLFYMPRGYVHDVTATEQPSFSLTIVFSPFTWGAVLDLLASRLRKTSAFLAPLPAGALFDEKRRTSFRADLKVRLGLIREELAKLDENTLADELAMRHIQRMTMPPNPQLGHLFSLEAISLDTWLQKRPGVACHLTRNCETVTLMLPGGYVVQANRRVEAAFRQVINAETPFRISAMHDSLTGGAKVALAKKLVACGLLVLAPAGQEHQSK